MTLGPGVVPASRPPPPPACPSGTSRPQPGSGLARESLSTPAPGPPGERTRPSRPPRARRIHDRTSHGSGRGAMNKRQGGGGAERLRACGAEAIEPCAPVCWCCNRLQRAALGYRPPWRRRHGPSDTLQTGCGNGPACLSVPAVSEKNRPRTFPSYPGRGRFTGRLLAARLARRLGRASPRPRGARHFGGCGGPGPRPGHRLTGRLGVSGPPPAGPQAVTPTGTPTGH